MEYLSTSNYITPAIIIACFVYLVKFFGKTIADQRPLVDDRSWDIELGGLYFTLNLLISVVVGTTVAIHSPLLSSNWLINPVAFLIISVIGLIMHSKNALLGEKIYKIKIKIFNGLSLQIKNELKAFIKFSEKVPVLVLEITLFYFATLSFLSHNIAWFTIIFIQTLFISNFIALFSSLRQIRKLPKADIYLIGMPEPIKSVTLLKVTDDSVRTRNKGVVTVYNKNQVLKLDVKLPKDLVS
ncbi:MAG: hypothetical protein WBC83_01405 [Minisyncoccia bacterium]